jgi:hypothetical protein
MNLQLHHVVSHVSGATGMNFVRAIVGRQRDRHILAKMALMRSMALLKPSAQALLILC